MPGQLFNNWPTDEDAANQQFHRDVLAPLVNQIIQDIKVIKENALISTPERLTSVGGPFELGAAPPEGTGEALDLVLDRAGPYLAFFPEYSVTLKKDIKPLEQSSGLGPVSIFSDIKGKGAFAIPDLKFRCLESTE